MCTNVVMNMVHMLKIVISISFGSYCEWFIGAQYFKRTLSSFLPI